MWIKTSEQLPEIEKPIWFIKIIRYFDSPDISQELSYGYFREVNKYDHIFFSIGGDLHGYSKKSISHWQYASTPELPEIK